MSKRSPSATHSSASKGLIQTIGDAQMVAGANQLYQSRAQLSQSIDAQKQKLADLRKLMRQNDRVIATVDRKIEAAKAVLQAKYGHCFDLRGKQIPWDEMVKWLAANSSGDTVTLPFLVAIQDPHTAFWFKVRWL